MLEFERTSIPVSAHHRSVGNRLECRTSGHRIRSNGGSGSSRTTSQTFGPASARGGCRSRLVIWRRDDRATTTTSRLRAGAGFERGGRQRRSTSTPAFGGGQLRSVRLARRVHLRVSRQGVWDHARRFAECVAMRVDLDGAHSNRTNPVRCPDPPHFETGERLLHREFGCRSQRGSMRGRRSSRSEATTWHPQIGHVPRAIETPQTYGSHLQGCRRHAGDLRLPRRRPGVRDFSDPGENSRTS